MFSLVIIILLLFYRPKFNSEIDTSMFFCLVSSVVWDRNLTKLGETKNENYGRILRVDYERKTHINIGLVAIKKLLPMATTRNAVYFIYDLVLLIKT